jgi:hypothetical protein
MNPVIMSVIHHRQNPLDTAPKILVWNYRAALVIMNVLEGMVIFLRLGVCGWKQEQYFLLKNIFQSRKPRLRP